MMPVKLSLSGLKATRWYEYVVRLVLGGAATVLTGVIAKSFGTSVGGLFLALPAIFCASATLIERHERRAKENADLKGDRRGREAAALDAAGAGLGSIGLMAFAAVFSITVTTSAAFAFVVAMATWTLVSLAAWLGRRKLRIVHRHHRASTRQRTPGQTVA